MPVVGNEAEFTVNQQNGEIKMSKDLKELFEALADGGKKRVKACVKFDTEDEAIAHFKRCAALKIGDEVCFYDDKKKEKRGCFFGWDDGRAKIIFMDEDRDCCLAHMVLSDIIFSD